jgi:molybdopterin/thiamine biosynthesis adenylyltransferase
VLRPRIKPGHAPRLRDNGAVWFGPWLHGMATELADDSGVVWAICERLDGTRTRDGLVHEIAEAFPGEVTADEAGEVLEFLIDSGWVQDLEAPIPPELTARDLERYRRGIEYLETVNLRPETDGYRLQARLKASRVTVLGVGGVGSAVAANLAASGVGRVHCVDHDVVELSNLSRQLLFAESDRGQRKVDVTVRRLRELNSDIEVTGTDALLDGPDAVLRAVEGSDAFVLCADRPRGLIRMWANEAGYRSRIPWLTSAYTGPEFSLAAFVPGRTACAACLAADARDEGIANGFPPAALPDEKDDTHQVTAASAQISGHYLALETIHLLLGMRVQTAGRSLQRFLIDYDQQRYVESRPRPDCPVGCGDLISP